MSRGDSFDPFQKVRSASIEAALLKSLERRPCGCLAVAMNFVVPIVLERVAKDGSDLLWVDRDPVPSRELDLFDNANKRPIAVLLAHDAAVVDTTQASTAVGPLRSYRVVKSRTRAIART